MINLLSILQALIFITLGMLHIYWALGGKWGFEKSLPTNESGERVLNPKPFDSAVVGIGLNLFALFNLTKGSLIPNILPHWAFLSGGWFISLIFILRAIGDFKYVGFFKKVKSTSFAKLDAQYFSPLCLAIGIIGLVIEMLFLRA